MDHAEPMDVEEPIPTKKRRTDIHSSKAATNVQKRVSKEKFQNKSPSMSMSIDKPGPSVSDFLVQNPPQVSRSPNIEKVTNQSKKSFAKDYVKSRIEKDKAKKAKEEAIKKTEFKSSELSMTVDKSPPSVPISLIEKPPQAVPSSSKNYRVAHSSKKSSNVPKDSFASNYVKSRLEKTTKAKQNVEKKS